jgi:hypothetical protein
MNQLGIMGDALAGRRADDIKIMAEDYGLVPESLDRGSAEVI